MLSLVTVPPVITAFHSCCLLPHVFFLPSKPLAGLGRNWNRYFLTMLTWNRRDSTPLSAMEGSNYWGYGYKTQHSYPRSRLIIWRRPEAKFGRNVVRRNNNNNKNKTTKMRTKSPQWIKKLILELNYFHEIATSYHMSVLKYNSL